MVTLEIDDVKPVPGEYDDTNLLTEEKKKEILRRKKSIKFTERRLKEFLDDFDCVVVNDFGDDYHLSEEEREKKNKYYKLFQPILRLKRKYRNLSQFIDAYRSCLNVLDVIANDAAKKGVITSEEFKNKFFKGKVEVYGLEFPKYIGKDRKRLERDYLIDFILSDEPSDRIFPEESEVEDTDEVPPDLTEEELEFICSAESKDEVENYIIRPMGKKKEKAILKSFPNLKINFKEEQKKKRGIKNLDKYLYSFTQSDIQELSKYDNRTIKTSPYPEFHGDCNKNKDVNRFLAEVEEWKLDNTYENYHGKMLSKRKIEELELKMALDNAGFNVRKLYNEESKEKKLKKLQKKKRKKIQQLKKEIIKTQEGSKKFKKLKEDVNDKPSKKKKKKRKKASDKKLLKATGNEKYKNLDDWKKDVFDWT